MLPSSLRQVVVVLLTLVWVGCSHTTPMALQRASGSEASVLYLPQDEPIEVRFCEAAIRGEIRYIKFGENPELMVHDGTDFHAVRADQVQAFHLSHGLAVPRHPMRSTGIALLSVPVGWLLIGASGMNVDLFTPGFDRLLGVTFGIPLFGIVVDLASALTPAANRPYLIRPGKTLRVGPNDWQFLIKGQKVPTQAAMDCTKTERLITKDQAVKPELARASKISDAGKALVLLAGSVAVVVLTYIY